MVGPDSVWKRKREDFFNGDNEIEREELIEFHEALND